MANAGEQRPATPPNVQQDKSGLLARRADAEPSSNAADPSTAHVTASGATDFPGSAADDVIEIESQESFPASDAPSWTLVRVGEPGHVKESLMLDTVYPASTPEIARTRRELAPDIQAAFDTFSHKVFAEGALPAKTKQLIAVAVAHVTQCPYCIRGHTKAAMRHGATPQELMEAIWVAAEMRAGGAYAHSTVSLTAMNDVSGVGQT